MTTTQKPKTGATTSMTTTQKPETTATTTMTTTQKSEKGCENILTQILTEERTHYFIYGAAAEAGLVLIIVIIFYIIKCCMKKRKEKKTPTSTADLEYGLSERVTPEDHAQAEEATQPLCVNDTESNPYDNLYDCITPVEVQVRTQPSNQSPHEQEANGNGKNEPVYSSPITKENSPPSNSTVVKGSTVDIEGDINGDENDDEDSTPFDKGCVPTPHNSDRKRYQALKRIYENCTKPRHYMNLELLKSKTDHQNGAQAESSNTSAARRTSPAYVNVPKKPSNSTVVKGSTVDIEGDINGNQNDNEDSTPFDKGCVPTPHNSDRKRYQPLKRIYENCTKPRHYMNLELLKSKTDHQNSAQAESSNTSAARRTSPAYVNVPKKQPLLQRQGKATSDRRVSRSTPVVCV